VWQPVVPAPSTAVSLLGERVLLAGAPDHDALARYFSNAAILETRPGDTIEAISAVFAALGPIAAIVWDSAHHAPTPPCDEVLTAAWEQGVLQVFRLVKALLALDYGVRDLRWLLITVSTQAVLPHDVVNPTHAALHGLAGSMAKEYPHWQVRLLDLEASADLP